MTPNQTREEMCLRGLKMKLLTGFAMSLFAFASYGQVPSTNGNFTATTPSNLSLQAGATPTTRLTILNSNGFVGINTTAPSDWLHVNGNVRANQFNTVNGIFNTTAAATNMSFNINGTNRMTLLSGGNFGIGTAAPADLLHINGIARANQLNLAGGTINTIGAATNMSFNINGTNQMTLLSNGNLGIGTNAPSQKLEVNGYLKVGIGDQFFVRAHSGAGISEAFLQGQSTGVTLFANPQSTGYNLVSGVAIGANEVGIAGNGYAGSTAFVVSSPSDIRFRNGGVENVRFTSAGNVGIGTTAPGGKLHVNGSIYVGNNDGSAPYRVSIGGSYGDYGSIGYGYKYTDLGGHTYVGTEWASQLKFDAGGFDFKGATIGTAGASVNFSSLMKIDNNGNVGIGTSTPGAKLSFANMDSDNVDGITWYNPDPLKFGIYRTAGPWNSPDFQQLKVNWNTGIILNPGVDSDKSYVDVQGTGLRVSSGNVGIGTINPNPAYKLDVAGTINATSILVNGQPISGGTSSWANIGTDINFLTGSVGIGKAPAAGNKLDVEGNVNSTGIFLNSNPGLGDPTFTTRSAGTKFVLSPSLASAAADYAFGASANTLWSSVNTTSSSFKWFGGTTLAATLTGGGNLTLGGSGSIKARNVIPSSINLTGAGATTTLTASSHYYQNSTVAQTIKLPVVTTLSNGHQFFIKNSSTQPVTVQTSAGTALQVMAANATLELTCINKDGGTGTASWQWVYNTNTAGSPTASQWTTTGSNISYAAGNVGIGTSTPIGKLDINAAGVQLRLSGGTVAGGVWTSATEHLYLADWNTGTKGLLINMTSGNIGIGTTSPSEKLEVNGNVNVGLSTGATTGYGSRLNLRGLIDDGDPIWMSRYNAGPNQTELRVNIGDDVGGEDAFTVGNFFYGDGQWKTFMKVQNNGNVGIGTAAPDAALTVKGTIHTNEVKVDLNVPGPDYVFEKGYPLMSLEETKAYIDANKHLPEVPSAKEMEKNGVQLGEMNLLLLKKLEELTLHLIEQQKTNQYQAKKIVELEEKILRITDK
jgi:hypothetical protein